MGCTCIGEMLDESRNPHKPITRDYKEISGKYVGVGIKRT